MDDELNVTYFTFHGHVDLNKYRFLYFFIMFTVYVLILFFNVSIVCLIWIHKNLHEPMYIFIAALLINAVLYSTNIYPKLLIDFLSDKQIISYSACLFQFFVFYTLSGSESLLLSVMSYDRYVSICKPLQYPTIMRKTRVSILLVSAWSVPACHVAVTVILVTQSKTCNFTIQGIFCNYAVYGLQCVQSRALTIYGIVPLLDHIIVPLLFIIFTYTKILIIVYQSSREVRKKAAETCLPHLIVLTSFFCLCVYDITVSRMEANLSTLTHLIITLQKVLYHPLFNPLIYGLKLKAISRHLKALLCPKKKTGLTAAFKGQEFC
ncbi:olfactory receptor 11A1-like [Channa argus]|uniref:olfactory receptor 11A1-like n=1 Tax=Channa argus TaxID=215402 RepID=UPI003521531E